MSRVMAHVTGLAAWGRRPRGPDGPVNLRHAATFAALLAAAAATPHAFAAEPLAEPAVVCISGACAAVHRSAYPGLVVGTVTRVLTQGESTELFDRARAGGAWPTLPADPQAFARLVRAVALHTRVQDGAGAHDLEFIALMTEDEYRDAGIDPGVFVRYAPHGPDHDAPPADQPALLPYWNVTGCVMALCRLADAACEARYLPGIYERHSGVPLAWRSATPLSQTPVINPRTQLPLKPMPVGREPSS